MRRPEDAREAIGRLKEGNAKYVATGAYQAAFPQELRQDLTEHGQHPFVCIVTCSDSRVIPETIFSLGLGEAFVIRVAGNVVGPLELGSIEYAIEHLGVPLVFVLGHTHCGAVEAALSSARPDNHISGVISEIRQAIGSEKSPGQAVCLNVENSVRKIREGAAADRIGTPFTICGGLYHIDSGRVEFFEDAD